MLSLFLEGALTIFIHKMILPFQKHLQQVKHFKDYSQYITLTTGAQMLFYNYSNKNVTIIQQEDQCNQWLTHKIPRVNG